MRELTFRAYLRERDMHLVPLHLLESDPAGVRGLKGSIREHDGSTAHDHERAVTFLIGAEQGDTADLVCVATEVEAFDLCCEVPGHYELGMTAPLVVEET